MSLRLKRVSELLKRELGEMIGRELVFTSLVTVQQVDITPDLRHAHVYISVLGGAEQDPLQEARAVINQLQNHRKELQAGLARRVVLKYTPHLHFKLDEAIERGTRVIDILQSLDIPETTDADALPDDGEEPESPEESGDSGSR